MRREDEPKKAMMPSTFHPGILSVAVDACSSGAASSPARSVIRASQMRTS